MSMDLPADDDRRLPGRQANAYLGYRPGTLEKRLPLKQPPYPSEIDADGVPYYRLAELRRYSRGYYALMPASGAA
jgi:hypothetical protein